MITFKLNGEDFQMPTSWDDVKYRQYLRTFDITGESNTQVISIFTDIPEETLKNSQIIGLESVLSALSFATKPMETNGYCDKIGTYTLPNNSGKQEFNIQLEWLSQFEDMMAVSKGIKEYRKLAEAYPKMVAIYLQKIRDGKYDYAEAMKMEAEILEMPAKEVLTVGSFFLIKVRSLLNGTEPTSQSTPLSQKKQKPASKSSRKRSGSR